MKKLFTGIVGTLAFMLLLGAAANTFVTQNLVVQQTSNLATATAASLQTPNVIVTAGGAFPRIIGCNGGPSGLSAAQGSLCIDPSGPALYQNQDGTTSWLQVGSNNSASIVITAGTAGNVNETSQGTYDWLYVEAWGVNRFTWHSKAKGGWLLDSFDYLSTQGASSTDARAWTNFSATSDDTNTIGIQSTGNPTTRPLNGYNGSGTANTGWHFRLPSDGTQHQVFWQGTGFNANTLVTAGLSCAGVISPQTTTFNTIAGSGMDYRAVVTWTAPRGCDLVIQHQVTLCIGGSPCNLYIGPIIAN